MRSVNLVQVLWKLALLGGVLVMASSYCYCSAGTVVSVTGSSTPPDAGYLFLGGEFGNLVASSWTQTVGFSDMTIEASLDSQDASFRGGTAYLMSAIGPGTTPASEVAAPVNFSAPVGSLSKSAPLTVLFSGLDLGPGTYYLVLSAPEGGSGQFYGSPLGWQIPRDPVVTTAPGVTLGITFVTNTTLSPDNPFAPGSDFIGPSNMVMFDVTGTTPEPSSLLLLGCGLLVTGLAIRRRSLFARP